MLEEVAARERLPSARTSTESVRRGGEGRTVPRRCYQAGYQPGPGGHGESRRDEVQISNPVSPELNCTCGSRVWQALILRRGKVGHWPHSLVRPGNHPGDAGKSNENAMPCTSRVLFQTVVFIKVHDPSLLPNVGAVPTSYGILTKKGYDETLG